MGLFDGTPHFQEFKMAASPPFWICQLLRNLVWGGGGIIFYNCATFHNNLINISGEVNPNIVKFYFLIFFFHTKMPLFSFKIKISKIRKDRHEADDVFFHYQQENGHQHSYPIRSVGAVWCHPPFSWIQNGRQLAILNPTLWQIIQIATLTCSLRSILISNGLKQFWRRYNMNCSKIN
jgi:hypothetical protein